MSFYSLSSYSQLRVNQSALDGGGTPPFSNLHSFSFDGVDEYFIGTSTYSELDGQNKMTVSFWVKPSSSHFGQIFEIAKNSTSTNTQIRVFIDTSQKLRLQMNNTTLYLRSNNGGITLNAWNNVIFCIDKSLAGGDRGKVFVNGVDDTFVQNIDTLGFDTSSSGLYIGESVNNYMPTFNGLIDEIAIWSGTDQRANVSEIYGGGQAVDLNNLATAPQPTTWQRMGDNATWNGATWTMTDVNGGYTNRSINMVEANRTTDVPT
jgi:hypothetical protein